MAKTYLLLFLMVFSGITAHAADAPAGPSAAEARLREALRSTTIQLRTAEADKATLQGALDALKTESEQQKTALTEKADGLIKQIKTDKEATDKTIATMSNQISKQEEEILTLKENLNLLMESLEKWKAGYAKVSDIARGKEAERGKLAIDLAKVQNQLSNAERKNIELYKTGTEILTRYEKFGLGEALTAQEPFVGTTRVKLENFVQDYKDKLTEQKIASAVPMPPTSPTPAPSAPEPAETPAPVKDIPAATPQVSQAKPTVVTAPAESAVVTESRPQPITPPATTLTPQQIIAAESRLVNQKVDSRYLLPPPKSGSSVAYPLPNNDSNTTLP